jgi:hypothetical protein
MRIGSFSFLTCMGDFLLNFRVPPPSPFLCSYRHCFCLLVLRDAQGWEGRGVDSTINIHYTLTEPWTDLVSTSRMNLVFAPSGLWADLWLVSFAIQMTLVLHLVASGPIPMPV